MLSLAFSFYIEKNDCFAIIFKKVCWLYAQTIEIIFEKERVINTGHFCFRELITCSFYLGIYLPPFQRAYKIPNKLLMLIYLKLLK